MTPRKDIDFIFDILLLLFLFLFVYGLADIVKETRQKKVDALAKKISQRVGLDEPPKYDSVLNEECRTERSYILSQVENISEAIETLEEKYSNLSINEFEIFLTEWNREIGNLRTEISNYNYSCFEFVGIKGLALLAEQLGLGYIQVVMYDDKSDIKRAKIKLLETRKNILESLCEGK